jgi:hypothetical protein
MVSSARLRTLGASTISRLTIHVSFLRQPVLDVKPDPAMFGVHIIRCLRQQLLFSASWKLFSDKYLGVTVVRKNESG